MVDKLEAAAYLHTLHMEDGQTIKKLSEGDGTDPYDAFGFPGRDYSPEYHVTTTPLYAATPTEDAREQIKVLEEALEHIQRIAPPGFKIEHIARTALGNKETDRHG